MNDGHEDANLKPFQFGLAQNSRPKMAIPFRLSAGKST